MRKSSWLLAFASVCFSVELTGHADDNWPRFRGADATGVAPDNPQLPDIWSQTKNVAWTADVPGWGWSNPIVWGDRVFLTTVVGDEANEAPKAGLYLGRGRREPSEGVHHWLVFCFDLNTGKEIWRREAHQGRPEVPRHPKSTYASETPATDGERLYVLFGDVGLYCYDFDGELIWSEEIAPKKTFFDYGAAASPVLHEDQLIMVYDNQERSYIASYDKESGELLWKTPRTETSTWATPYVWENELRTEIIVPGIKKIFSYDTSGQQLWWLSGRMSNLVIPSPFAVDGVLYVTSGYIGDQHRPVFAIKPGATGDITNKDDYAENESIAWYQPTAGPYNPSPIVYQGLYYTLYDRGFITCHDAKTGEEVYGKKRFAPGASFTASPWAYNGKIFCLSEDGTTYVVQAGKEFELLHENELDELCLATPAISQGRLLIRTVSKLYCIAKDEE